MAHVSKRGMGTHGRILRCSRCIRTTKESYQIIWASSRGLGFGFGIKKNQEKESEGRGGGRGSVCGGIQF